MATGSNKDVKLTLSVETLGDADIKALKTAVLSLAQSGTDAAPEFQKLADQIDRLGQQNDALQSFKTLNAEVEQLAAKQSAAATQVGELKAKLDAQAATVNQAREAQSKANTELLQGQEAYVKAGNAVRLLKAETDAATKGTTAYAADLGKLVNSQNESRTSLISLRDAQKQANAEVSQAEAAQKKLETAYNRATKESTALGNSLAKQQEALQATAQAAEALGASTTDIASSEARLLSAFNDVGAAAQRRTAETKEMAEADRLLAIQERALNALYAESQRELQSMTLAQVDATASIRSYEQAKERATANSAQWQQEADAIVAAANATRALARETEVAVVAARELASQAAFEKAAADSQKLLRAAEYVRFWEQALEEGGTEAQKTAAAAAAAAERIEQAFKTTGVRSVEALNAEIAQLRAAMETLRGQAAATGQSFSGAFTQGEAKINALQREMRELNGTLTIGDRAASLFANSLGQITAGNILADGVGFLINKVKELGTQFFTANIQVDSLRRTLTQITGSTQGAAEKIAFLRSVAETAGVSVSEISKSFISFNASATAAGISTETVDRVFKAVTVSAARMGLSGDQVSRALEALGQIASKGTVSMEELRQQLGDALPGAMASAAKGLGLTTGELTKLAESGNLLATQFLPSFAVGLESTFGDANKPVEGLAASFGRLQTAITTLFQQAVDSAPLKALASTADFLSKNLQTVVDVTYGLGKALLAIKILDYVKGLGGLATATTVAAVETTKQTAAVVANTVAKEANAVATRALAAANTASAAAGSLIVGSFRAVAGAATAARSAISGLFTLFGGFAGLAAIVVLNAQEIGKWLGETAAKWMGYGKAIEEAEKRQRAQVEAEQAAQKAREAAQLASDQAFNREVTNLTERREQLKLGIKSVQEATKADELRATNIERIARLYGTEAETSKASVDASAIRLGAVDRETTATQNLLLAAQEELARRRELIALSPQISEKYKKETDDLSAKVAKMAEEVRTSQATAAGLRIERAERELATEALKDNSQKVDFYAASVKAATANLAALKVMQEQGLPVAQAVAAAQIGLAKQTGLYNNALKQKVESIGAASAVEKAGIAVEAAGLSVKQNAYNLLAQSARASGDYANALYYEMQAKRLQIQQTDLAAKAKIAEANAELAKVEATRQELEAQGPLTKAKKDELEARRLNALAQKAEAAGSADVKRALEEEIATMARGQRANSFSTSSRYENSRAIDGQTASLTRLNAERQREAELEQASANDPYGRSPEQIKNLRQQGGPVDASYVFDIERRLRAGEDFSPEEIPALANAARVARENAMLGGPGSVSPAGRDDNAKWVNITRLALERAEGAKQAAEMAARRGAPRPNAPTYTPAPNAPAAPAGGTVTVNLNLNGQTTSIQTSSQADADRLANFMRSLERAAGTSS